MSTVVQLLLDKEGFPNNHLPVLVVRQNDVKFFFFFSKFVAVQFNIVLYCSLCHLTSLSAAMISGDIRQGCIYMV